MMRIIAMISFSFILNAVFAQEIEFQNLNWKEALELAQSQNKLIFVEFQTRWCSNCRKLEKNTFTDPELGTLMNEQFINIKYDAEIGEGYRIASLFRVSAFPTMLFFDSNGIVQMRLVGFKNTESLNAVAKHVNSLKTDERLAGLIRKLRTEKFSQNDMTEIREFSGSFYYTEWSTHLNKMFNGWTKIEKQDSLNVCFLGDNFSMLDDTLKWHVISHSGIPSIFDDRRGEILRRQRFIEQDLLNSIEEGNKAPIDKYLSSLEMYQEFRFNTIPNFGNENDEDFIDLKVMEYHEKNQNYTEFRTIAESLLDRNVFSIDDDQRLKKDFSNDEYYQSLTSDQRKNEIQNPKILRVYTKSLIEFVTLIAEKYLKLFDDKEQLRKVISWSDHAIHLYPRSINVIHKIKALDRLGLKKEAEQVIEEVVGYQHKDFGHLQFDHFVEKRNRS